MQRHVINYGGQPVGIAVPEDGRLKFIAVKFHVMDLDQQFFDSLPDIEEAIHFKRPSAATRGTLHAA